MVGVVDADNVVSIAFRLNVRLRDRLGDDLVVLVLEVSQLPFG